MGFYPVAVYYNKTQHTNNTPHSNTAHKTTQTIEDRLHTRTAMQIQLQLQLNNNYIETLANIHCVFRPICCQQNS
jgi:hypothetical protein